DGGAPRCVATACVDGPDDVPVAHDTCLEDGSIGHCDDQGEVTVETCPEGTWCVDGPKGPGCVAEDPCADGEGPGCAEPPIDDPEPTDPTMTDPDGSETLGDVPTVPGDMGDNGLDSQTRHAEGSCAAVP